MTPESPAIEIVNVTRRFDDVVALDDVSLTVHAGEFFSLLGPSGCGKTTLLRIIAGLDLPDSGRVRIAGEDTTALPAHRRPVNTVFQSYALFPHMNVWKNIAFGLRMKKTAPSEIEDRVGKMMELVQIATLAGRMPNQLSGGQKQRVALARAIINEPRVLLLDEPLAALDLKLRKELQIELLNLQDRLGITFIYVTHDQEEALVLSDRIAVMRQGKVEQLGAAKEVYERPRTRFAGQFLGSCSLLEAKLKESNIDGTIVATPLGDLRIVGSRPSRESFTLAIRPEKIQLLEAQPANTENVARVRIEQVVYVGSESHYEMRSGAQRLRAEVMNTERSSDGFEPGHEVWAYLPPRALIILDD
jgi:spermidine/putrescine transport system ATP-binding protein